MFPKTSVLCLATKDSDILRFILAVTKVYLAYQFRAPNSQPFEVIYYAESSMYLKSFVNSSIYINLFCFLVSRPKTVPSPKKGHTKVVIRESTVCLSGLAPSLK